MGQRVTFRRGDRRDCPTGDAGRAPRRRDHHARFSSVKSWVPSGPAPVACIRRAVLRRSPPVHGSRRSGPHDSQSSRERHRRRSPVPHPQAGWNHPVRMGRSIVRSSAPSVEHSRHEGRAPSGPEWTPGGPAVPGQPSAAAVPCRARHLDDGDHEGRRRATPTLPAGLDRRPAGGRLTRRGPGPGAGAAAPAP